MSGMAANSERTALGRPFQPGQSGNPNGRPKKSREFVETVQRFLAEFDPKTDRARLLEILDAQYGKATEGDTGAARALKEWAYGKEPVIEDAEAVYRELEQIAQRYGKSIDDVIREAEARGIRVVK